VPTRRLPRGLAGTGAFLAPDQPFPHAQSPHSPTSSVFSVPATVRTTGSGAPLFAAAGGQAYPSASARVFSLLPPSPQVHKERERRRLRKRSRPGEREERDRRRERDGVFELVEVTEGRASGSGGGGGPMWEDEYGYGYGRRSMDSERASEMGSYEERDSGSAHGHADPSLPPNQPPTAKSQTAASMSTRPRTAPTGNAPPPSSMGSSAHVQSVPATPTKHTLLSRIGSVKRWAGAGVRRSRGMSTGPDEIAGGTCFYDFTAVLIFKILELTCSFYYYCRLALYRPLERPIRHPPHSTTSIFPLLVHKPRLRLQLFPPSASATPRCKQTSLRPSPFRGTSTLAAQPECPFQIAAG
jgi:hypothetical protein